MAYLTQYSSSVPVIKFYIDQTVMTIGQNIEMDICIPEEGIAGKHATIEVLKQSDSYRFIIKSYEDEPLLELNGETLSCAELKDADWLIIGGVEFQFTDDGVNKIKETAVAIVTVKSKSPEVRIKKSAAKELKLAKDVKQEVKTITTKEFIANSRQSRRRLAI